MRSPGPVEALFAGDPLRLENWADVLDRTVHVRVGARPIRVGFEPAITELSLFLSRLTCFAASYLEIWPVRKATWVETDVLTSRAAIRAETLVPCAIVFRTGRSQLVQDARFYLDTTPFFEEQPSGC